MSDRRVISPAELEAVFKLAATIPDLTVLPAELEELATLRGRVERGEAAFTALRKTQNDLRDAIRQLAIAKGIEVPAVATVR